jgi:hypothetical protein
MVGWVKRPLRTVGRPISKQVRRVLVRLLRPLIVRIDTHMQWLFDRQQDDRMRIVTLEQQVRALQRQVGALQRQGSGRRSFAA